MRKDFGEHNDDVKAIIENDAVFAAQLLGNTATRLRSSVHDWAVINERFYFDEPHVTISTYGGDVKGSIHLYYDENMNFLGMSVFVGGVHD